MFEKNENKNEPDALDERIHGLRNGLRASAKLKAAAISGEPLRAPVVGTKVHVRRFAKAVTAYALGVMFLLGMVAVLPAIWESDPVSSPGTTTEPNVIAPMNEVFSDEMNAKIDAAYIEKYNRSLEFHQTGIHEVWYLGTYNDGIVFYKKFERSEDIFISYVEEIEVAGWQFSLASSDALCVYKDETVKRVDEAYEDGWLSDANVAQIIEQYDKVMNRLFNGSSNSRPIE